MQIESANRELTLVPVEFYNGGGEEAGSIFELASHRHLAIFDGDILRPSKWLTVINMEDLDWLRDSFYDHRLNDQDLSPLAMAQAFALAEIIRDNVDDRSTFFALASWQNECFEQTPNCCSTCTLYLFWSMYFLSDGDFFPALRFQQNLSSAFSSGLPAAFIEDYVQDHLGIATHLSEAAP